MGRGGASRLHLRGKSHCHAPAKMGAGSSPCANTLNESEKAHARGAWIGMDWNTCGVGELNTISIVDMTIKLCPSTNPITSMFATELHVCKQHHTPTAN